MPFSSPLSQDDEKLLSGLSARSRAAAEPKSRDSAALQTAQKQPADKQALNDTFKIVDRVYRENRQAKIDEANKDRGLAGEVLSSAVRGVTEYGGDVLGRAMRAAEGAFIPGTEVGPIGRAAGKVGEAYEDLKLESPFLNAAPEYREGGLKGAISQGVQSVTQSLAAGVPSAVAGSLIGSAIPVVGTVAGGIAGFALGAGSQFGLAEFDRTIRDADALGRRREESEPAAIRKGLYEAGFEFLSDIITGGASGLLKPLTKPALKTLEQGVRQLTKEGFKKTLARGAAIVAGETSTELVTAGLQAQEDTKLGLGNDTFWDAARDAFGPAIVASVLFGGIATGAAHLNRRSIMNDLSSRDTPADKRFAAAKAVEKTLKDIDPRIAKVWAASAHDAITKKQPIPLDEDLVAAERRASAEEAKAQARAATPPTVTKRPPTGDRPPSRPDDDDSDDGDGGTPALGQAQTGSPTEVPELRPGATDKEIQAAILNAERALLADQAEEDGESVATPEPIVPAVSDEEDVDWAFPPDVIDRLSAQAEAEDEVQAEEAGQVDVVPAEAVQPDVVMDEEAAAPAVDQVAVPETGEAVPVEEGGPGAPVVEDVNAVQAEEPGTLPEEQAAAIQAPALQQAKEPWEMTKNEFVGTRNAERPDFSAGVLNSFDVGTPGIESRAVTQKIGKLEIGGHNIVYRGPSGRPIAAARLVQSEGRLKVKDFVSDKSSGLLSARASVAVGKEIERLKADVPAGTMSPDAARLYHHRLIEKAIREGKPVPTEVMAEYPDLQKEIQDDRQEEGGMASPVAEWQEPRGAVQEPGTGGKAAGTGRVLQGQEEQEVIQTGSEVRPAGGEEGEEATGIHPIVQRVDSAPNARMRGARFIEEGRKAFPEIREADAEEAGRWAYVVAKGEATQEQFDAWKEQMRSEGRTRAQKAQAVPLAKVDEERGQAPSEAPGNAGQVKEPWTMTRKQHVAEIEKAEGLSRRLINLAERAHSLTKGKRKRPSMSEKKELQDAGLGTLFPDNTFALTEKGQEVALSHRKSVVSALAQGEDVPVDVLREYPDLAKKAVEPASKKGKEKLVLSEDVDEATGMTDAKILEYAAGELKQGERNRAFANHDAAWEERGQGYNPQDHFVTVASTNPDWFRNQGWLKKDVLGMIGKAVRGEGLTERQREIVSKILQKSKQDLADQAERHRVWEERNEAELRAARELAKVHQEAIKEEAAREVADEEGASQEERRELAKDADEFWAEIEVSLEDIDKFGDDFVEREDAEKEPGPWQPTVKFGEGKRDADLFSTEETATPEESPLFGQEQKQGKIEYTPPGWMSKPAEDMTLPEIRGAIQKIPEGKEGLASDEVEFYRKRMAELQGELSKREASEAAPDSALFSLGQGNTESTGITAADTRSAIEPILENWKATFELKIIQDVSGFPEDMQEDARRFGTGPVKAAYDPRSNTVYLVHGSLTSTSEAQEALLHEAAHLGLKKIVGQPKKWDALMEQVAMHFGKKGLQTIADNYGLDLSKKEDRLVAAEEKLAELAQTGEQPNLLKRIVQKIKEMLRAVGFTIEFSDGDIHSLLGAARRYVESGKGVSINAFERAAGQARYSSKPGAFYSQMERQILRAFPQAAPVAQARATLDSWVKKGLFRAEEWEWSGIPEWLDKQEKKISKDDLLQAVRENMVELEEVRKGGNPFMFKSDTEYEQGIAEAEKKGDFDRAEEINRDWERFAGLGTSQDTKFQSYILPGGENYREFLLKMPSTGKVIDHYSVIQDGDRFVVANDRTGMKLAGTYSSSRDAAQKFADDQNNSMAKSEGRDAGFRSTHWDEPNVLVHFRTQDFTDADGKKVLLVEEVQSDWHQKGKKEGYAGQLDRSELELLDQDQKQWVIGIKDEQGHYVGIGKDEAKTVEDAIDKAIPFLKANWRMGRRVPSAPFKKTWPMLGMKRVLRLAAEEGYDRVAWTTGAAQAERYDLSKQIRAVEAMKDKDGWHLALEELQGNAVGGQMHGLDNLSDSQLADAVGKDLAEKIIKAEQKPDPTGYRRYEGADLKVGGEGMKKFYDEILPSEMNRYVKKWGAKTGKTTLEGEAGTVHAIDVTPEMRESVMQGQPLFKRQPKRPLASSVKDALPEVVAGRMEKARNRQKDTILAMAKAKASEVKASFTRHFQHIDQKKYGKVWEILRRFEEIPQYSKKKAERQLKEIIGDLSPEDYDTFSTRIILGDMLRDIDNGTLDPENPKGLPFGFQSREEVEESIANIEAIVGASPEIGEALARRTKIMRNLRKELVKIKKLPKEVLNSDEYWHHQVLEYIDMKQSGTGTSSKDVRAHRKGWMIGRVGSVSDYNTEYVEAEFEVLAQGISQVETVKAMEEIDRAENIKGQLKGQAKSTNIQNLTRMLEESGAIQPGEDPFKPFKQRIAMGMTKLSKLAADGTLRAPLEFESVVESLAERGEDQDDHGYAGSSDPKFFNYLSWLISTESPGAPEAALIFKSIKQRNTFIKDTLGSKLLTWKNLVPDDYTTWKPKPFSAWYMTNTVPDKVIEQVISKNRQLRPEDVRKILARGQDEEWVLPEPVATQLDNFRTFPDEGPISRAAEQTLNWWKQYVLMNPFRVLRYNINNLSGDADISMAYAPKILTKYARAAARDSYRHYKEKGLSPSLTEEFEFLERNGVVGSGMTVHDIPDITKTMANDKMVSAIMGERPGLIARYWNGVKGFTTWRENILRVAAYRYFLAELNAGKKVYGASDPAKVDAIQDVRRKAALLSRELIGDYGAISHGGQFMRKRLIPFYSWVEINAPRYVRMFRNLTIEGESTGRAAGVVSLKFARKSAALAFKASMLFVLVNMWNKFFWPEEEEELGESGRRQLHIILGRRDDGSIMTMRFQGAFSDMLSWFGAEDAPSDISDLATRKITFYDWLKDAGKAFSNRSWQMIRPELKSAGELITGKSTYPDIYRPMPIRDRMEYAARMFSLEPIYKRIAGKPLRGNSVDERLMSDVAGLLSYTSDPGELAYYSVRKKIYDFLDSKNVERPAIEPTDKSNALYYYKQALKFADMDAAQRYLKKYAELGGTMKGMEVSVAKAHPLAALPVKYRQLFLSSMTAKDKKELERSVRWYETTYRRSVATRGAAQ